MNADIEDSRLNTGVFPLPEDILEALAAAVREELDAGRSVRIRKLGMWTPYIGESGKPTVVFHSEMNLKKGNGHAYNTDTDMNATDIDIPFPDETLQAHKTRPPQKTALIDVQLLFDEVREEFGLVHLPASPVDTRKHPAEAAHTSETATPQIPDSVAPVISATDKPVSAAAVQREPAKDGESGFHVNRERLFNPPEPEKPRFMRIAAGIMTAIMICLLAFMVYTSGILNGVLPESMKHHPAGMERRVTPLR